LKRPAPDHLPHDDPEDHLTDHRYPLPVEVFFSNHACLKDREPISYRIIAIWAGQSAVSPHSSSPGVDPRGAQYAALPTSLQVCTDRLSRQGNAGYECGRSQVTGIHAQPCDRLFLWTATQARDFRLPRGAKTKKKGIGSGWDSDIDRRMIAI